MTGLRVVGITFHVKSTHGVNHLVNYLKKLVFQLENSRFITHLQLIFPVKRIIAEAFEKEICSDLLNETAKLISSRQYKHLCVKFDAGFPPETRIKEYSRVFKGQR